MADRKEGRGEREPEREKGRGRAKESDGEEGWRRVKERGGRK